MSDASATRQQDAAPRLLYVVSEDWYFLSHRLPMARAARDAGFDVHVATRVGDGSAAIKAERFTLHPIPFARGGLSPFASFETIGALRKVHRAVRPAVTHHVSLQPTVLGLIATLGFRTASVNALTGLGFVFTSPGAKARGLRSVFKPLLRTLLNRERSVTLVQNPDDEAAVGALGVAPHRIKLVPGSGVDTQRFQPMPDPNGPPTIGFIGRLLDDKGIRTLIAAHKLLRARGDDVRLLIGGTPDPANPASVREDEAAAWNHEPGIIWLGHVDDIAGFWSRAHIAVLPSRREGLPLSLLEAAACGRPMVATDVPGCREVAIDGETALLVPVDDAPALADAIGRLVSSPQLRATYGTAARKLAVERFSTEIIGRRIVALYRELLAASRKAGTP